MQIEDQLKRLLTQLEDVEHMKEELDEEEYQSTRKVTPPPFHIMRLIDRRLSQDTVEQLQEFEQSLSKMLAGNITLVDHLNAAQLAIQAAIRDNASPDILQMFLKKENGAMRTRLSSLESDYKLGRINQAVYEAQAIGILGLLEKLKEPLSVAELAFLNKVRYCSPTVCT